MPKYRLLSLQELQELEKEFINFLILNGIDAHDWLRIKNEDIASAENMIEQFSDMVFERIMSKVDFLEFREEKEIKIFQCLRDKMVLVAMIAPSSDEVNFTDSAFIQTAAQNPPGSLKVYTLVKPYSKQREVELFEMINSGCTITDGKLFKTLCLSLPG